MKTAGKTLVIIAAALLIVGILTAVIVLSTNCNSIAEAGKTKFVTNTVDISADFNNISIDSDTEKIRFVPSEDGKCKVVFYESENEKHNAEVKDGMLSITKASTKEWYELIPFGFESPSITVYLPKTEYGALSIRESTGDIEVPKDFKFETVGIDASTGDIDCRASVEGRLGIETSTGKVHVEGITAGDISISVSTGHVEISSVNCSGDVYVKVSTGRANLTDVTCKNLNSNGSTGDVTLKNVIASEKMSVERSTGDIKLDACDANEIEIETDTGSVTGSLLSEKVFITKTDTGRVEVPETTTGGRCKITTDTGSIKIVIK